MRGVPVWLVLILLAVTIFTLSNTTTTVVVRFWQWQLFDGPVALAIVGAGVLGALLTFLSSLPHRVRLGGRIRDLEQRLRTHEGPTRAPSGPGLSSSPPGPDDTRRFP
ncbi:MAG TPA: LapA family protein [bacterium]|nr:LapA family protein [bacterium]